MKASNRDMLLLIAGFIGGHVVTIGLNLLKQKQTDSAIKTMELRQQQISSQPKMLSSGNSTKSLNNITYDRDNNIYIESF